MSTNCINSLVSGGIIVNYACSSACKHCLYRSSPRREKACMTPETLRPCLEKVRSLGCRSMHIGGGEPLLNADGLITVLDCCAECNIDIDYLETNCSWHKDEDATRRTLDRLRSHGVCTVMVSVDPFHNEYIPFAKVRAVIDACRDIKMGLFAWKMEFAPEITRFDEGKTHKLDEYRALFGDGYITALPGRYGLNMNGRALETFRPGMPAQSAEAILARCPRPCGEMWQTSHFHVDLYGNYVFTSCVGLSIACEDLGKPVTGEVYPFLHLLATEGLAGLYRHAVASHAFEPARRYVSKCDLCLDIRRYLVNHRGKRSADLQPVGFYEDMA